MSSHMVPVAPAELVVVPIALLAQADSPRTGGVDAEHVRQLAEVAGDLPPIVVHRSTMQVIDGMHRVHAALARGQNSVRVRFFDGDAAEAFVLAVESNIGHGLPLTLSDRRAAAARIARSYPYWSDRRIAATAGISPKTVAAVRARSAEEIPRSRVRVGLDGRVRRLPTPDADRCDVTDTPARRQPDTPVKKPAVGRVADTSGPQATALIQALRRDPSLRFSETGRTLLRLLDLHIVQSSTWGSMADSVPPHCTEIVAELARTSAVTWQLFADSLDRKSAEFDQQHRAPIPPQDYECRA